MDRRASHFSSRIDVASEPKFALGSTQIDPGAHEVTYGAARERLQPQTLKVLIALAARAGDVVTREELIDRCWDGRYVSDDVINRAILLLRGLAKRTGSFWIETVPKAGYRLREEARHRPQVARRRILALVVAIGLAVGIAVIAPRWVERAAPTAPRIALIPFASEGDRTTGALSNAIDNSLARMLSDSSLPVERSATRAAAGADLLLTGAVRRDSSSVIVTMHLEDARDASVLFSKEFRAPLTNSESLPDQLGAYAAANLAWDGPLLILAERQVAGPRLTTMLLKHLFLTVEGGDLLRAYEMAVQDAPKAPKSTMAQLSVAHHTGLILARLPNEQRPAAVRRARAAMLRAEALSPTYGDVYTPRCRLYPSVWQSDCEDTLRKALRVDPDAPYPGAYLRRQLGEVGRSREALQYARMSVANDPYKPGKLAGLIGRLEALNQHSEAEKVFQSAIRWWPHNDIFYQERVDGMAQRGDLPAVAAFVVQSPANLFPVDREAVERLAVAVEDRQNEQVRALCSKSMAAGTMATLCLVALTQVGEIDAAFQLASAIFPRRVAGSRAEEERIWLVHPDALPTAYLASPALAPMRRDPRFLGIAEGVGLLRYWRLGRLPDFCHGDPEPVCGELGRRG